MEGSGIWQAVQFLLHEYDDAELVARMAALGIAPSGEIA
jgi:hypothetical protein